MELAAGGTLRDVLARTRPALAAPRDRAPRPDPVARSPPRTAAASCTAISSPANLMFRRDADLPGVEVMLGDFGVAHLPDASGQARRRRAAKPRRSARSRTWHPSSAAARCRPPPMSTRARSCCSRCSPGTRPGSREGVIGGLRDADDFGCRASCSPSAVDRRRRPAPHRSRISRSGSGEAPDDGAGARRSAAPARAHRSPAGASLGDGLAASPTLL